MQRRKQRTPRKPNYTMCGRKRSYRNEITAKMVVADAQHTDSSTRTKNSLEGRVYYHTVCHGWHTTSMPLNVPRG